MMTNTNYLKLCIWLYGKSGKKPLETLEQTFLTEVLQDKRLIDIEISGFSPNYIHHVVAPKIWKGLSVGCGSKVGIRRLKMLLDQTHGQLTPDEIAEVEAIAPAVKVEEAAGHTSNQNSQSLSIPKSTDPFYKQASVMRSLQKRLTDENNSVVFVYGCAGTGKTSLVSQTLAKEPCCCRTAWCNLREESDFFKNWDAIRERWQIAESGQGAIADLCHHLQMQPDVLVFDQWERLFASDTLSGIYSETHAIYGELLKALVQQNLQGKVIIATGTVAPSFQTLEMKHSSVTHLDVPPLPDSAAQKILQEYQLKDSHLWPNFIATYRGNPLKLRLLSASIARWYGGSIQCFQKQNTVIGGKTLGEVLAGLTRCISEEEQRVLYFLMLRDQPVLLCAIQDALSDRVLFSSEIVDAVKSLENRFLVEAKPAPNSAELSLQPSIQRYLFQEFVRSCVDELMEVIAAWEINKLVLLRHYDLALNEGRGKAQKTSVAAMVARSLRQKIRERDRLIESLQQLQEMALDSATEAHGHLLENLQLLYRYLVGA